MAEQPIILGIIAEFNPFHNGHLYLLEEARCKIVESAGKDPDLVIVAMSGNYVQRGEPAVFHKSVRTACALAAGADMVVEIPTAFSTSQAQSFAQAGIKILTKLGANVICFGTEWNDLEGLSYVARTLAFHEDDLSGDIRSCLQEGHSFAVSRAHALTEYLSRDPSCPEGLRDRISHEISRPNNILAIEYLCAAYKADLKAPVDFLCIPRVGSDHNSVSATAASASASALRNMMQSPDSEIRDYVPKQIYEILKNPAGFLPIAQGSVSDFCPIFANDFSMLLNQALYRTDSFNRYPEVHPELDNRIQKNKSGFHSFDKWTQLLTSKTFTASRARRSLLHILLDTPNCSALSLTYAKILGIDPTKDFSSVRAACEANHFHLLSRSGDDKCLNEQEKLLRRHDICSEDLYRLVFFEKYHVLLKKEQEQKIILFPKS